MYGTILLQYEYLLTSHFFAKRIHAITTLALCRTNTCIDIASLFFFLFFIQNQNHPTDPNGMKAKLFILCIRKAPLSIAQ